MLKQKIENYIRAGFSGLFITTAEEKRAESEIFAACKTIGFNIITWSPTQGATFIDTEKNEQTATVPELSDPEDILRFAYELNDGQKAETEAMQNKSVLILRDIHMFLDECNPSIYRLIKEVISRGKFTNRVIILLGCRENLPPELKKEITVLELTLPDRNQLEQILLDTFSNEPNVKEKLKGELLRNLVQAASGMTAIEAENAFSLAYIESGKKTVCPEIVHREKCLAVKKSDILEIVETKVSLDDVGGLDNLKNWVIQRKNAFSDKAKEYGLSYPKGVLATGIQGCGKSLLSKATASLFEFPLIRLDVGKIFGHLVGQSESNMRAAIETAEAISPCVLWIDEVEKGFSGTKSSGSTDGGTTSRIFGSFISWMNEKTKPVFVVATANDITALPPEFLRKGRFDEIFFVDLPNEEERKSIWEIHIRKNKRDPKNFNLPLLVNESEGYSGAEIEAAFLDAMFRAFSEDVEVSTAHVVEAIKDTVPLSKMRAKEISDTRRWANERAKKATKETRTKSLETGRSFLNN